jgi:hypothetical protein
MHYKTEEICGFRSFYFAVSYKWQRTGSKLAIMPLKVSMSAQSVAGSKVASEVDGITGIGIG